MFRFIFIIAKTFVALKQHCVFGVVVEKLSVALEQHCEGHTSIFSVLLLFISIFTMIILKDSNIYNRLNILFKKVYLHFLCFKSAFILFDNWLLRVIEGNLFTRSCLWATNKKKTSTYGIKKGFRIFVKYFFEILNRKLVIKKSYLINKKKKSRVKGLNVFTVS